MSKHAVHSNTVCTTHVVAACCAGLALVLATVDAAQSDVGRPIASARAAMPAPSVALRPSSTYHRVTTTPTMKPTATGATKPSLSKRITHRRVVNSPLVPTATRSRRTSPSESYNAGVWDRLAQCESTGNWHINSGNGYYGGIQFSSSTWLSFGGDKYAKRADLATKAQQIEIGRAVLAAQGPHAWPVCSIEAGLQRGM